MSEALQHGAAETAPSLTPYTFMLRELSAQNAEQLIGLCQDLGTPDKYGMLNGTLIARNMHWAFSAGTDSVQFSKTSDQGPETFFFYHEDNRSTSQRAAIMCVWDPSDRRKASTVLYTSAGDLDLPTAERLMDGEPTSSGEEDLQTAIRIAMGNYVYSQAVDTIAALQRASKEALARREHRSFFGRLLPLMRPPAA